ncbi:MAG: oligosaccharide flippase family protein [Mycobacterium sp.]|nr:oligosaccharide flippase family protein [Mycobacterium sp.]
MAIRGGAIRVVGYVIGILISLAAATILVRHLGISGFGRYITVISLIALVGGVTEAGIAVYGIREYGTRDEPDRRQLMADLLGMRLTLTLVGVAAAVCFGLLVGYGDVLVVGTVLAGAGLLVQVTADVLSIPLQATLRLGRLTVVELTRRLLALALIGVLAAVGASLLPFLAVPVAASAGALALLALMVRASLTIRASFDRRRWRALFAETLPFAMAMSIGAVYFYVTIIVMSVIASELQTGFFGTSFRVTQVALAIPALALTAIFPLITHHREGPDPELGDKMGKVFDVAIILGVWMSLAMALGASFIMDVIAGHRGNGAVTVLRIQGLVLTASFVSASSMFGLLALRRYRPMLITTSSALVLNVALGLILIPPLGARGGAIADVVTEILVALGLTVTLIQSLPRHGLTLAAIPSVIFAAALAAAVWLIPVGSVAHVLLATGVYFGVLLALGTLPDEVIRAARRVRAQRAPT